MCGALGKQALQHMQSHRVRDIGTASLKDWLDSLLSSDEPLGSDEEETEAVPEETEPIAEQGDIEGDTEQVEADNKQDTQHVESRISVCVRHQHPRHNPIVPVSKNRTRRLE